MASGLDRVIALTLNLISGATGLTVSNIPAILTDETLAVANDFGSGVAKKYKLNEINSALTDDFSSSGVTIKAANAIASTTPRVNEFYVIKRATAVAAVMTLTFSAALITANVVAGTVNGHAVTATYASSNADTLTALAATIQALEEVTTAASNGTDTITITFEQQVEPSVGTFTVTLGVSQATATVATSTPAVNIVDDIAAAMAESATNEWFMLLPTTTNRYAIQAAAASVETLGGAKIALFHTTDAAVITSATTDVASLLQDNDYQFSGLAYHDDSTEMIHCRVASRCLAVDPGAVSFALKSLTGATSSNLTAAQIGYAEGKNCNTYTDAGPGPLFMKGVMANGVSIEAIRDSIYAKTSLESDLYNLYVTRDKIPVNKDGRQLQVGVGTGTVTRMESEGVFDPDAGNAFTIPDSAVYYASVKTGRVWTDARLDATHLTSGIKIEISANIGVA